MATVHIDIIDGNNATFASTGTRVERIAKVSGLTGDGDAKLYAAVTALGMPVLGAAHPSIAGITLKQMLPKADASDIVTVRLIYESIAFQPNTITVAGTLAQTETTRDVNNNAISVSYTYPAVWNTFPSFQDNKEVQTKSVPFYAPQVNVTVTKTKTYIPWSEIFAYNGTVNERHFRVQGQWLEGDRCWMCSITASSNDGGETYSVTYNFIYNPSSWDTSVVYTDPHWGGPPPNTDNPILQPGAAATYIIYTAKNFNNLRL